jgi:radical SAM-linked protein
MRFLGHLDLVSLFRRATRRAGLPVHYSIGFHPQPCLSFGPPLPLGMSGLSEWMDVGLDAWTDPKQVQSALNQKLPAGIRIDTAREVPLRTPALSEQIKAGEYVIALSANGGLRPHIEERIHTLNSEEKIIRTQWSKKGPLAINLKSSIVEMAMVSETPQQVKVRLLHSTESLPAVKVKTIIDYLCESKIPAGDAFCMRVASGKLVAGKIVFPC